MYKYASLVKALLSVQCQMCFAYIESISQMKLRIAWDNTWIARRAALQLQRKLQSFRSVRSGPLTMKEEWLRAEWSGRSDVTNPGFVLMDLATLSFSTAKQRRMVNRTREAV